MEHYHSRVADDAGGIKIVASEKGSNESEKGPDGRSKERKKERRKVKAHPYAATQKLSKCKIDGATLRLAVAVHIRVRELGILSDSFFFTSCSVTTVTAIALKLRAVLRRNGVEN